jgi:hypothetical protein
MSKTSSRRPSAASPAFDEAESPLAWLATRRGRGGRPFLDAAEVAAGERLRADLTRSAMLPRTTTDWSRLGSGSPSRGRAALSYSEAMIAAGQRVSRALDAVGPDFAGLLVDVCGFLKGLECIEHERLWPPRTAKVVLRLALRHLARHYGLQAVARGPERSQVRAWGAADYRPVADMPASQPEGA